MTWIRQVKVESDRLWISSFSVRMSVLSMLLTVAVRNQCTDMSDDWLRVGTICHTWLSLAGTTCHRRVPSQHSPVSVRVDLCWLWCREELKSLGDVIETSLSAAEFKVKQKRQEELARMRLCGQYLVSICSCCWWCNCRFVTSWHWHNIIASIWTTLLSDDSWRGCSHVCTVRARCL